MNDHGPHPAQVPPVDASGDVPGEVPWGLLDAAAVFVLSFLLLGLLAPVLGAVVDAELAQGVFFPLSLGLMGAVTVLWVRWRHGPVLGLLLRRRPTLADAGAGLLHGVAGFFVLNVGLSFLLQLLAGLAGFDVPEVQESLREATTDGRIGVLVIASAVLVAPVSEELFFRGLLYQGLRRSLGVWPGIAASALLFGLAHYESGNIAGSLYALVVLSSLGAYLAWTLQRRSLVTPIVMHGTFNGLAVAGILLAG